jgi:hypothetical protein
MKVDQNTETASGKDGWPLLFPPHLARRAHLGQEGPSAQESAWLWKHIDERHYLIPPKTKSFRRKKRLRGTGKTIARDGCFSFGSTSVSIIGSWALDCRSNLLPLIRFKECDSCTRVSPLIFQALSVRICFGESCRSPCQRHRIQISRLPCYQIISMRKNEPLPHAP